MNLSLLAAAVHHASFLNTLQTAVLYDLCANADESGEVKPNVEAMALRWRVRPYSIKSMIKELELAGIVEKTGQKIVVKSDLYKCLDGGCQCQFNLFPHPGPPKEGLDGPVAMAFALDNPEGEKKPLELQRPNPGSINGIWEKLKTHWRTRWGTPVIPGYIERQLGEAVRGILSQPEGSLDTMNKFERAFVNYLTAAKDSESGKISLKNFGNVWGVWVDRGDSIKNDAKVMLEDALDL